MDKGKKPNEIMKLAEKFYEGMSEQEIDEMEKIMLDRSNFFGERTIKLEEFFEGINEDNIHEKLIGANLLEKR